VANNPHDTLFRRTFGNVEHALGLLRSMLPEALAEAADWSSLQLRDGGFIDSSLAERQSDLLFALRLHEREAFVYVVLEHQSSSDKWMALRMLSYVMRVYEKLRDEAVQPGRLPFVFPLVVHHSRTGWKAASKFSEMIDLDAPLLAQARPFLPDFHFALLDLSREDDRSLQARLTTDIGRLVVLTLKHAAYDADFLERLAHWTDLIERIVRAPGGLSAWSSAIHYLLEVTELSVDAVCDVLESGGTGASEVLMSTAEKLRAEGRLDGEARGRVEGEASGRAKLMLRLLTARFGALPEPVVARVHGASVAELEAFAERFACAGSDGTLEEVLGSS
jgi:hypothetical protein